MLKVILPANEIPEGSTVNKVNGKLTFTLKSDIIIYGEGGQTIQSPDGSMFLVNEKSINIISKHTQLMWEVSKKDFYHYLWNVFEEEDNQ